MPAPPRCPVALAAALLAISASPGTGDTSPNGPDSRRWDAIVHRHVDGRGMVDYAALAADPTALDAYIASLAEVDVAALSRDARLALYLNAYNAFTVRLILDHWRGGGLRSILDIPEARRWKHQRWRLGDRAVSLDQLEHGIIREQWEEPRIHFALVCAAVGCPPLRREAYVADRLDEQLEDQTRLVHRDDRWLRYDAAPRELHLTKLYDWYGQDFVEAGGSVRRYVAQYAPAVRRDLDAGREVTLHWLDYDWSLNRQSAP